MRLNNFHKLLPVPFVIYADFEGITEKIHAHLKIINHTPKQIKNTDCRTDMVIKLCCYDHDKHGKPMQIYRGENDVYKFMEKMVEEVDIIIARKQRRNISISH